MIAKYGVFCGDARSRYLADALKSRGGSVVTWNVRGKENAISSLRDMVKETDILIGPIPFSKYMKTRGKTSSELFFSENASAEENTFFIEELLCSVRAGQLLYAGKIPKEIQQELREGQVICRDFLEDKEVQKKNAVLTAEGCLTECIKARERQIKGARVLVCGFGCCGRELARVFAGLGACVTVGIRRTASAWQAACEGYSVCYIDSLQNAIAKQDIVINTVPEYIFFEEELRQFGKNMLLVEIASAPGGFDPVLAKKMGVCFMLCPGLPGRYFPQGAAGILADCIERKA